MGDDCIDDPDPRPKTTVSPSAERALLEAINAARDDRGLPTLVTDPAAGSIAREHARWMSNRARVRHNHRLEDRDVRSLLGSPSRVAENVGKGPRVDSLHVAFMKSPRHRANILGRFDAIGIGVVFDGHTYWATEIFVAGHTPAHQISSSVRLFHPAALLGLPGGAIGVRPETAPEPAIPGGGGSAAPWLAGAAVVLGLGVVRGARSRSPGRAQ